MARQDQPSGGLSKEELVDTRRARLVPLSSLHPAPWNPRLIRDSRFKQLCDSIRSDPDFLWLRPVLAQANGEIFAGNMRYRAVQHLGWESVPAIMEDVPDKLAKERALRDNNAWGEWQEQELSELLADLQIQESDLEVLGFEPWKLNQLIGDGVDDPRNEWQGMPEFEQPNAMPHRTIYVHFAVADAVQTFSELVEQSITDKTKDIWYPEQKPRSRIHEQYMSDES